MENQNTQQQTQFNPQQPQKKKAGCLKIGLIGVGIVVVIAVIAGLFSERKSVEEIEAGMTKPVEEEAPKYIQTGEVLKTKYFDIVAEKVEIAHKVNTGNQFTDLKAEEGTRFIIIDASFKNVDTESRMLTSGELLINYNGKDYTFDKAETILAPGYGLLLEQINPLTTKKTKLVYKVPSELKGPIFWKPGRAGRDEVILLGDIKE